MFTGSSTPTRRSFVMSAAAVAAATAMPRRAFATARGRGHRGRRAVSAVDGHRDRAESRQERLCSAAVRFARSDQESHLRSVPRHPLEQSGEHLGEGGPAVPVAALPPRVLLQGRDSDRDRHRRSRRTTSPIRPTTSVSASSFRSRCRRRISALPASACSGASTGRITSTRSRYSSARAISARSGATSSTASPPAASR